MSNPRWTVDSCAHGAVTISGNPLAEMLFYALDSVAASIHDGDGRADAWTDYVIARGNLAGAKDRGETESLDALSEAAAEAWAALAPELAATLRLDAASALLLADRLFEAAGRVGTVR